MALKFTGSICLDDIVPSQIKVVKGRHYVNFSIHESKEPLYTDDGNGGKRLVSDHFLSCAPKKDERIEGENYIFGNCKRWIEREPMVSAQEISEAPAIDASDNLPWLNNQY